MVTLFYKWGRQWTVEWLFSLNRNLTWNQEYHSCVRQCVKVRGDFITMLVYVSLSVHYLPTYMQAKGRKPEC